MSATVNATVNATGMARSASLIGRAAATSAISFLMLASLTCGITAFADKPKQAATADQSLPAAPKLRLRIAVDQSKTNEIRDDGGLPRDVKEGLQAMLVERLVQSGRFQVMEREATAQDQQKQEDTIDQQKRESLPEETASAKPRQRRTAAKYIITPTVTGLQETSTGHDGVVLYGISIGGKKKQTTLSINIRISDAETSETIDTFTAEGKVDERASDVSGSLAGICFHSGGTKAAPISRVVGLTLNDAVKKICVSLAKEPWYALVAAQDPTTHRLIIAAGSESGVDVGMEFAVNQTGPAVFNPETHELISRGDETPIGRIRIVRVERSASYAEVVSGDGFDTGNTVREIK